MTSELPSQRLYKESQISKTPVQVIVRTCTNVIKGQFHVRGAMRLIDELGFDEAFVPVTNAVVCDAEGKEILRTRFIAIHRTDIIWMVPESEIEQAPSAG